jgi:hypothetical protein
MNGRALHLMIVSCDFAYFRAFKIHLNVFISAMLEYHYSMCEASVQEEFEAKCREEQERVDRLLRAKMERMTLESSTGSGGGGF